MVDYKAKFEYPLSFLLSMAFNLMLRTYRYQFVSSLILLIHCSSSINLKSVDQWYNGILYVGLKHITHCWIYFELAAASDKVYQLLAHGRWFFPGTPTSSTTKTGFHEIAEILLKVALNTNKNEFILKPIKSRYLRRCYEIILLLYLAIVHLVDKDFSGLVKYDSVI